MKTTSVVFEDALNHYSVCAKIAHSAVIRSHAREDALCFIFIAEKRNYPLQIQNRTRAISRRTARCSHFLAASLLSLVRVK